MPASESALHTCASSWSVRPEKASAKCGRLAITAAVPAMVASARPTSATITRVPPLVPLRPSRSFLRRSFIPGGLDAHAHDLAIGVDQLVPDLHRELEGELGALELHRDLVEVVHFSRQEVGRHRVRRAHVLVHALDPTLERAR